MNNFFTQKEFYTVLELSNFVREVVHSAFPEYIWICGEIQDLRLSRNRAHINLNLVQKDQGSDQIIAQARGVIFENVKARIFSRLKQADTGFELKKDIEVKLLCKVDFYPKTGQFSLVIVDIDPVYTLGKVAQNRQKILAYLKDKGLLDKNKAVPLTRVPTSIGLITSMDSAAYHDFISELRHSGYGFKIFAYDSHVQGRNVERDITRGLKIFNNFDRGLDAVAIIRGGGSTADLSFFDSKVIGEEVAGARLPVISGLGHEINTTITDLTAHTSLKTPTKVAQFLVRQVDDFLSEISGLEEDILDGYARFMDKEKTILRDRLMKCGNFLQSYFRDRFAYLAGKKQDCLNFTDKLMSLEKSRVVQSENYLRAHLRNYIEKQKTGLKFLRDKAELLDPEKVLKRGYSITRKAGKAVKSIDEIVPGDVITTVVYRGEVSSTVIEKHRIIKDLGEVR